MPPHLDHDLDCIPNEDDQDFLELGITQLSWENYIRNLWDGYFDTDYDDFWADEQNTDDFYSDYYEDYHNDINNDDDPFQGNDDFWEDIFNPDTDGDGIRNDEDHDDDGDGHPDSVEDCPGWDGDPINTISTKPRTITCDYYYIKSCEGPNGEEQWYDYLELLIPCPGCSEQDLDYLDIYLSNKLINYLEYYFQDQSLYSVLWPLVQDCPALGDESYAWQCFDEKFKELIITENPQFEASLNQCIFQNSLHDCLPLYYNWTLEHIDSGLDFQTGGADWSKHSPMSLQSLPTWNDYNSAYPRNASGKLLIGADNVYNLVGGDVQQLRIEYPTLTNNPCALKVSIALNGAGVTIPHIWSDNNSNGIKDVNEPNMTYQGADGKYYFVRAEFLINYMLEVFPVPTIINNQQIKDGLTTGAAFGSDHGIYAMLPIDPVVFQASGHCDIFFPPSNNLASGGCGAGCQWHKNITKFVYLWILN